MIRGSRRRLRVLAAAGLLFAVGSTWQIAAPPTAVAAQTDLTFTSDCTWTADPEAARVHVEASITATSHTTDVDGRRYYYDTLQMTLPKGSEELVASSVGEPRAISILSESQSGVVLMVSLGRRLYAGDSDSFRLTFDVVDSGVSTDRDLRFGRNLMSFPVSAFGSPGVPGSSVTVVFPSSFTVQEEFGGLTRVVTSSADIVFASGAIDDPTALAAWFTAVKPVPESDFSVRQVSLGSLQVTLRYWADDPGWADQVERVLRAGYPVLSGLIGLGDPIAPKLDVEEASSQQLGGFSGAYDRAGGRVSISYFADPFVIVHEAAHLWFNSDLSSERWVNEGFASYYAAETLDKLGWIGHGPLLTDRLRKAAVPLSAWTTVGDPNSTANGYLYAASMEVAGRIAAIAGQDGLRAVWAAARSGRAVYQPANGSADELLGRGGADSRRLLDLLEQITGLTFVPIWSDWVVGTSDQALLAQRSAARAAYAQVQAAEGSWNLPPDLRRSMEEWEFDQSSVLIAQVRVLLDRRAEIVRQAALEGTTAPAGLQRAFETVGTAAAMSEAVTELAVLNELALARQVGSEDDGVARALGLIGTDPQANLADARVAFASGDLAKAMSLATKAQSSWESASAAGQVRVLGGLCVLVGLLMLLIVFVWTRVERRQPRPGAAN